MLPLWHTPCTGVHGLFMHSERAEAMDDAVIYVVDDDESICRSLVRLFRSVGLPAQAFQSAKAFLEHSPADRPACLVLDIRLPGLSGLDLQAALSQADRDLPIVFITGHGDVPTSVRAMKGGAVDFLQKPFNDEDLLDCVRRALELSRRRRAERAERTELQGRLKGLTPRERQV
ncbi:MAG TPA: response regulator, partial [Methylomirabilota bacterium]|nr:response regulator [Methylomirabilota bacterium]